MPRGARFPVDAVAQVTTDATHHARVRGRRSQKPERKSGCRRRILEKRHRFGGYESRENP
ncbi:hypothetical protein OIU77_028753 [Salix suchowensis]|uniref:Uncharacterized protein n=1 Tax=Salix suchowensis TaxID=1278906 RepID=A0ABQ9BM79_9ROSI|nr:hypothetical protein OIU77_028753 [Salix suchowensis]